jgi:hypothetical protein
MAGMKIKGKNIVHTRGDTAVLRPNLKVNGEPFTVRDGDVLTFSVKKNLKDSDYIFRKTAENGVFVFRQGDTQAVPFGNYWYDIELKLEEGQVVTVVGPAQYQLTADVTGGA